MNERWEAVEKVAGLIKDINELAPQTERHLPYCDILQKSIMRRKKSRDSLADEESRRASDHDDLIKSIFPNSDDIMKSMRVIWAMSSACRDRALFLTKRGRVGIGHETLQPGDQVWLLAGAKVPFILRRRDNGHMQLEGEIYVDGMMFGELWPPDESGLDEIVLD